MRPLPPRPAASRPLLLWAALAGAPVAAAAGGEPLTPESAAYFAESVRPKMVDYCGDCHAPDDEGNHVDFLSARRDADLNENRGLWKSVAEQLRNRTMPPADSPFQPTEEERRALSDWIDGYLRHTACDRGPYAGPVIARRLNRQEYDNTLRDLLFVDLKPARDFPADGAGGEGFDNNAETLFSSPILLERYLAATTAVLDAAVWTPKLTRRFPPGSLEPAVADAGARHEPRAVAPGEALSAAVTVYVEADVTVAVRFEEGAAGPLALRVDGVAAGVLTPDTAGGVPPRAETAVRLARGVHTLTFRNAGDAAVTVRGVNLWDDRFEHPPTTTAAAHERLLGVPPGVRPEDPRAGAREALARLARRAYRRPVGDAELAPLMALYDRAADRGDPWEEAVKLAARGVLLSPRFLFRTEPPVDDESGEPVPVDDHALASRLSYFLWASMPDETLFDLAEAGRLSDPAVLDAQVDRMLEDPRAFSFATHFAGQWLGTREVGGRIAPDTNRFRSIFSSEILEDLNAQPAQWFLYMLRADRPLRETLVADYAILNDRLSWHYNLAKPPEKLRKPVSKDRGFTWMHDKSVDPEFRRFELNPVDHDRRGGVLGMGGVLLASSYSHRTSPVLRGAWVLETLLGVKVPSPPADVPEIRIGKKEKVTVRERLARHRDDPACSACHNLMDPLGFALDNYDVVGRWRGKEAGIPIDASASLPDGTTFEGPGGLRKTLLKQEDRVVRHLTAKLLGYALGRSLEDGDDCTVDRIAAEVTRDGGTTRALVKAVVRSVPFRTVAREPAAGVAEPAAAHGDAPAAGAGASD